MEEQKRINVLALIPPQLQTLMRSFVDIDYANVRVCQTGCFHSERIKKERVFSCTFCEHCWLDRSA
jgi:hypothetical protein